MFRLLGPILLKNRGLEGDLFQKMINGYIFCFMGHLFGGQLFKIFARETNLKKQSSVLRLVRFLMHQTLESWKNPLPSASLINSDGRIWNRYIVYFIWYVLTFLLAIHKRHWNSWRINSKRISKPFYFFPGEILHEFQ